MPVPVPDPEEEGRPEPQKELYKNGNDESIFVPKTWPRGPNGSMKPSIALSLLVLGCQVAPPTNQLSRSSALHAVHEWGTFTSVMGSDGKTVAGLQHTEELLPSFVHLRDASVPGQKGAGSLVVPVHQKLETPVLYFYGEGHQQVSVDVSFPKGVISEWYPEASSFAPALGVPLTLEHGKMSWQVELLDESANAPLVPEHSVWAPSRRVAANGLRELGHSSTAGTVAEEEGFIFYRGLGCFDVPVSVTSKGEELTFSNDSAVDLHGVLVLLGGGQRGGFVSLGTIEAGGMRSVGREQIPLDAAEIYVRDAKATLAQSLEASGLFADEARAMVDTWTDSYFVTSGLRVLYVVPRAWTDEILPIDLDPRPADLVRTLVGRIEVMTEVEERDVVRDLEEAKAANAWIRPDAYGRFTEPKLRRAAALIGDPALQQFTELMITQAALSP